MPTADTAPSPSAKDRPRPKSRPSSPHSAPDGRAGLPPLRLLGIGLSFSWAFVMWEAPQGTMSGAVSSSADPVWIFQAIIAPLAAAVLMAAGREKDLPSTPALAALAALAVAAGTLLAALSPLAEDETARFALITFGSILTAIGPLALNVLWALFMTKLSMRCVEIVIPASFLLTSLVSFAMSFASAALFTAVLCLLPLLSGACLIASQRGLARGAFADWAKAEADHGGRKRQPLEDEQALGACLLVFAANAVSSIFVFVRPHDGSLAGATGLITMAAALATCFIAVVIVVFSKPLSFGTFYKWLYVPTILGVALFGLGGTAATFAALVLLTYTFMAGSAIMILFSLKLARETSATMTFLFCGVLSFSYLGCLVGGIVEHAFWDMLTGSAPGLAKLCLAIAALFACSILMLEFVGADSRKARGENKGAATADGPGCRNADPAPGAPDGSTASPFPAPPSPDQLVDERCDRIAAAYGLTRREREVLGYLVRGRSQPYIRDALCVSQNTVASHARSIYRKLGIHSKQGLLDLVESI